MTTEEIYALRLFGAVVGAGIAAVLPPVQRVPLRRTFVAVPTGFMLGGVAQWKFGLPNEPDLIAGTACIVSVLSWWAWNAVIKGLEAGWLPWGKKAP